MQNALIRSVLAIDAKELKLVTSIRCSLGLAIPLVGFWSIGHLPWGVLAGLGSIYAGLSSISGVYQSRLRHIVMVTILMTLVTILGTFVGGNVWLAIISVTAVGFLLSLYAAMRPTANLLATLATGTLIILSKILTAPTDTFHFAMGNGLLILAGGASQALMLTLFWPFAQHFPERQAVARVYDSLSDFASRLARGEQLQMLEGETILAARELMESLDRYKMKPEQVALRRALSAAEGVRASLVGLTSTSEEERPRIAAYLFYLSSQFHDLARLIRLGDILEIPSRPDVHLREGLEEQTTASLAVITALIDHLRDPLVEPLGPRKTVSDWTHHLSFRLIALESSPSLRSIALRHAIRYAIALTVATSISRLGSFGNGYWIPLTVCMVLKADYASTLRVGVSRALGTIVGVLVAVLLAYLTQHSISAHVAVVLCSTFGIYLFYNANYAIFTGLITLWVVFSVSASGLPERLVGFQRLEATFIGICIAVVAYRLLPTWQSSRVREVLCDAADAQLEFCRIVLLEPVLPERSVWERELDHSRALRYGAESVVESAAKEPVWRQSPNAPTFEAVLVDLEMNAALMLGLLAQRLATPSITDSFLQRVSVLESKSQALIAKLRAD